MSDYPATAKFLTPVERKEVTRRLTLDHNGLADEFDMRYFWDAIKDWKVYVHMMITIAVYTSNYSISLFLPTIIRTLGYTNETAQLMTVPPYIFACITCITGGIMGDRARQRGVFMIGFDLVSIVGLVMLIATKNLHVKYAAVFLVAGGFFPMVPMGAAWQANNAGGSLKRGVAIAMHVGFGNLGGKHSRPFSPANLTHLLLRRSFFVHLPEQGLPSICSRFGDLARIERHGHRPIVDHDDLLPQGKRPARQRVQGP